jgi:hypothetical protein
VKNRTLVEKKDQYGIRWYSRPDWPASPVFKTKSYHLFRSIPIKPGNEPPLSYNLIALLSIVTGWPSLWIRRDS